VEVEDSLAYRARRRQVEERKGGDFKAQRRRQNLTATTSTPISNPTSSDKEREVRKMVRNTWVN
jgi:hypothetical protein